MLKIDHLVCSAGSKRIVDDVSVVFHPNLLHVIVGPNGSGKSTFLKAFSGDWRPESGTVSYDGGGAGLARRRAVMSQSPELHFPLSVDEIVLMGRYPHFSYRPGRKDLEVCKAAMEKLSVTELSGRDYLTLSGGERQRVQFARALAQIWDAPEEGSRYLFLDEPVSSLDIHYQHQFLQTARSLLNENIVIIAVLHDLNLSLQYADRMLFMKGGRIVAAGDVPDIVKPELIEAVFGIRSYLLDNPAGSRPVVAFG
jgi:iron complex transport system ATP-binding protein